MLLQGVILGTQWLILIFHCFRSTRLARSFAIRGESTFHLMLQQKGRAANTALVNFFKYTQYVGTVLIF
jgi:hypothetical protein